MKRLRKVFKICGMALGLYLVYVLIFGVIIFSIQQPEAYPKEQLTSDFFGSSIGPDKVSLVDGRKEAGIARLNLITNAQESLDIAYYTILPGQAADIFFANVLEAADRGVRVRILLDGVFHNLWGGNRTVAYALTQHPNIQVKLYEPLSLLRPWRLNNRFHDKMMIVDGSIAMMGGRNIGDNYFTPVDSPRAVNDRDVVIINTQDSPETVLNQFQSYYQKVWQHQYSKDYLPKLSNRQKRLGQQQAEDLKAELAQLRQGEPQLFQDIDWHELAVPTKRISFIHNPIQRMNKTPLVWQELAGLAENAKESIYVQSPYVIPMSPMLEYLDLDRVTASVTILTNSKASSPNIPAISGYRRYRESIVDYAHRVKEYQGPGSIHAKSYVFDQRLSLVGSFNLDPRSTFLSTETMVVIDSQSFAQEIMASFNDYFDHSLVVGPDYDYLPSPHVNELHLPLWKSILITVVSWLTYPFTRML